MLIACRNKAATRTYNVAGRAWTFARPHPEASLQCNVTDGAAVDIFLSAANSNLFYAVDNPVATLSAPKTAPGPQVGTSNATADAPVSSAPNISSTAATPLAPNTTPVTPFVSTPTDAKPDTADTGTVPDIEAANAILAHTVRDLNAAIDGYKDVDTLRLALQIEASKTDPRSSFIAVLDRRVAALTTAG